MIPKHIDKDKSSNKIKHTYRFLAAYIWDMKNVGEKTLDRWFDGCQADSFGTSLMEVEATQAMNTRSGETKTYHLMVSFRPEDEALLSKEILHDIEKQLAACLGFQDHQRHCGIHKDTNNLHLHVAYNMINPRSFNRHEPFRDYNKLLETCRKIEKKYGLAVDPRIEEGSETKISSKARDMEARTGLESFESYIKKHTEALLTIKNEAQSWQQLHEGLAAYGLIIKPQGNGMVVGNGAKNFVKASAVDRTFSKAALIKILGPYEKYQAANGVVLKDEYKSAPLNKNKSWPERDALFQAYSELKELKKTELDTLTGEIKLAEAKIKAKLAKQKAALELVPMRWNERQKQLQLMRLDEKDEIARMRQEVTAKKDTIRKLYPFNNWNEFLQHEASKGNDIALKALRYGKNSNAKQSAYDSGQWDEINRKNELTRIKERKILETENISYHDQKALLNINKMEQLLGEDNFTYKLNAKGIVIFYLPSGDTIRDTGKEIHFSQFDKKASEIAVKFAKVKWGKNAEARGNSIVFVQKAFER